MDSRAKILLQHAEDLFKKRDSCMLPYWQDVAENFDPPLAQFTTSVSPTYDLTGSLLSSVPIVAARDLTGIVSSFLRPATQWMFMGTSRDEKVDTSGKAWLEWATGLQWRAMHDPASQLTTAAAMGDRFYTVCGQAVISTEMYWKQMHLLYRCWHLRDVVWCDGIDGKPMPIYRRWKPTIDEACKTFPGKLSEKITKRLKDEPYAEVELLHCIKATDDYEGSKKLKTPFVSIWLEKEEGNIIEEVGKWTPMYSIPRWQCVSGTQYAYSPAVVAALPDARLIQAITLTLLEAGEKSADPPRVAPAGVLRNDLQLMAGGVSFYDPEYDEKTGEILRPIMGNNRDLNFATHMHDRAMENIKRAFYLDKMSIAPLTKEMTAYETNLHNQEFIRNAYPLFGPTEDQYNGSLCANTFEELSHAGAFGSVDDIPDSIRGQDVKFRFESPLHQSIERQKGQQFIESGQLLAQAAQLDPVQVKMFNVGVALRDALQGVGTPAKWLETEQDMAKIAQAAQQQQAAQAMMQHLPDTAGAVKDIGAGMESFANVQRGA